MHLSTCNNAIDNLDGGITMDAKTCLQKLQYVGVLAFATVDE